jgi:streptogramin lyase
MPTHRTHVIVAAALGCIGCGGETPERDTASLAITVADVGLLTPESVLHDATADVYLVSNINGAPLTKDGNGFIARLSPDGAVLDLTWIDGAQEGVELDAPKGMAIRGDSLFVADIDVVRMFDRRDGSPAGTWPVERATFLNDVAVGPDGTIYVTDSGLRAGPEGFEPTGTDAVYRFDADGAAVPLVSGEGLGAPNGIATHEGQIVVATFGSGRLLLVDAASGSINELPAPPAGSLDGIVVLPDGSYLVSSWEGESVYSFAGDTGFETAVDSVPAPADIGYDAMRHRVLIPLFNDNRVEIRALPGT